MKNKMKSCSGYTGYGGPDPVERSSAAPDVALPHRAHGKHMHDGKGQDHSQNYPASAVPPSMVPPKISGGYHAPLPASMSHGWGPIHKHDGHLRTTGHGHQIGKKK